MVKKYPNFQDYLIKKLGTKKEAKTFLNNALQEFTAEKPSFSHYAVTALDLKDGL